MPGAVRKGPVQRLGGAIRQRLLVNAFRTAYPKRSGPVSGRVANGRPLTAGISLRRSRDESSVPSCVGRQHVDARRVTAQGSAGTAVPADGDDGRASDSLRYTSRGCSPEPPARVECGKGHANRSLTEHAHLEFFRRVARGIAAPITRSSECEGPQPAFIVQAQPRRSDMIGAKHALLATAPLIHELYGNTGIKSRLRVLSGRNPMDGRQ